MKTPAEHLAEALGGTLDDVKELDVVPTHVALKAIEAASAEMVHEALMASWKEKLEKEYDRQLDQHKKLMLGYDVGETDLESEPSKETD